MPRFLGQKKLRMDDEDTKESDDTLTMYNSVTAQELFSRHSDLAPFLIETLQQCRSKQLNPSLGGVSKIMLTMLMRAVDFHSDLK